jgi:hypothetical protein
MAPAAPLVRRLGAWIPAGLRARVPIKLRARARALLGVEPWPDLAVRHPLFREPRYRALRAAARGFDRSRPHKPVLERGHQTSYLLGAWLAKAGVRTAFHVGYASGRYVFYLDRMGIACGGTDLPVAETGWVDLPDGALDEATRRRLLRVDFLELTSPEIRRAWGAAPWPIDVCFSEATFEAMLPWRDGVAASVAKYDGMSAEARDDLLLRRLPERVGALESCFRNLLLIEPEPGAGGAGRVFAACAERLPRHDYGVWWFRPPFDHLFRLSPGSPVRQVVYAYVRDLAVTEALAEWASRGPGPA